jgi:polar amino acid transport system substrate-binding protein
MKRDWRRTLGAVSVAVLAVGVAASGARAESVLEKIKKGETIKIGYSNEKPYAYQNKDGKMDGFVNVTGLAILQKMGAKKVEGVLTEWGSLIPGLNAGRFDIITAGMYITPKRCKNVAFTEPMGVFAEGIIVKKGNPMGLKSYGDIAKKKVKLATGRGWTTIGYAQKGGIKAGMIMKVPDPAAILQAVTSGRAAVGGGTILTMTQLAKNSGGAVEVVNDFAAPDYTKGYSAYAFRRSDTKSRDAFDKVMKAYLGTPAMLKAASMNNYTKQMVPTTSTKTRAQLCKG